MGKRSTSLQQQKGKPGSPKALFLRAADKLLRETVAVTARENVFPKRTRWQFAYSLMDIANSFHTWVSYANGITVTDHALFVERYQAQSRGIAWLYALDVKMTAAQLCMDIPAEKLDFLHPKALAEERETLRNLKRLMDAGERTAEDVDRHYHSWIANAEYAGDGPIRAMDAFFTRLFRRKPNYKRKRRYLYGTRTD